MSPEYEPGIDELITDIADYLRWQQRLGHPGLPWEYLRERMARQKADAPNAAPPTKASPMPTRRTPKPKQEPVQPQAPQTPTTKAPGLFDKPEARRTLKDIHEELGICTRCKLHETRNLIVFGEGNPNADIMFVGEGPGADEDEQGRPFVGRAGKLLDRWIELGMGIKREDVYIGNIVKCRPPNNRDPEKEEVAACIPFIREQILAIQPKVLVLLGRVPMLHLLGERTGITKVHGNWYTYEGIPTMPLFHPSYCLRPPQDEKKRLVWEDIKKILTFLGMPVPGKK